MNIFCVFTILLISANQVNSEKYLVRIYTQEYHNLSRIELKSLDIAGRKYQEYFDIVVSPEEYKKVIQSGLPSEIIDRNMEETKKKYRRNYRSYSQTNSAMRNYAGSFPSICKIDSIGPTYEGRWIYLLKISDNPGTEEVTEPGVLFDGLHHAREWATVELILFYADTLLSGYGTDPVITDLIDNNEIFLIPIVNADGYVYDYPGQNWWRKNRKPYGGSTGTDANRNYNGTLNGDPRGSWGAVPSGGSMSNNPGSSVFCGAYSGFADCVDAVMKFHREHDINANITYHSYGEEIIWPWAYRPLETPDSLAYENIANEMASRIQKISGGNYEATGSLYPNTGTTRSWVYGFHYFIKGTPCLSYTIEVGTSFYQDTTDLDNIAHENWQGALYLALQADSIRQNLTPEVPSPIPSIPDTIIEDTFSINWSPVNRQWTSPERWGIQHLRNYTVFMDDIDSGTAHWDLQGFSHSSARSHSGNYSLYSGSSDNISNVAVTAEPYLVRDGDSLSFWCWYDLEDDYDVSMVEISENLNEWIQLDERYTGNSGGWVQKKYSLSPWIGKSIYIRFRTVTDGYTLEENFYVDDIYPVSEFDSISTLDSAVTDTFYTISGLNQGRHYFRVRGNNRRGWGNYSTIKETYLKYDGIDVDPAPEFSFTASSISKSINLFYTLPSAERVKIEIFDVTGRAIKSMLRYGKKGKNSVQIKDLKNGIWFIRLKTKEKSLTEKVVLIK